MDIIGVPPYFSGFVCAYHPAAPGLSPKHTIYAVIFYCQICHCDITILTEKDTN